MKDQYVIAYTYLDLLGLKFIGVISKEYADIWDIITMIATNLKYSQICQKIYIPMDFQQNN